MLAAGPAGDFGETSDPLSGHAFVARSPVTADRKRVAADVAGRRSTVMVLGEPGTGKEVVARHVHASSPRADGPFVPVDCSALAEGLLGDRGPYAGGGLGPGGTDHARLPAARRRGVRVVRWIRLGRRRDRDVCRL
jgi:hypothetical protein